MAPSLTSDHEFDFQSSSPNSSANGIASRILLLCPPSLSSHPEKLDDILAAHDRKATDIQMLDRLSLSLVTLPDATYDVVLILLDANGTRTESQKLLSSSLLNSVVTSLKPGGKLLSQDGKFAAENTEERREAIFAGLILKDGEMVKPDYAATNSVPLRFGKMKDHKSGVATTSPAGTGAVSLNLQGKRKNGPVDHDTLAGVGFVDLEDDLDAPVEAGNSDDNDLIDEDELMAGEDPRGTLIQPPECRPKTGKRRRACKDCTCGLAQRLEAEDAAKRATADQTLAKLKADDLAEVDFTVQGKVGSCGNCALGDAFRCDGCPYIGLPAFKPGEEVKMLNNEVQL